MEQQRVINISPLLEILSKDMDIYTDLYDRTIKLIWSEFYRKEEKISELNIMRQMLGMTECNPIDEIQFAKFVGECGKKILGETKKIRQEMQELMKSISSENISFGQQSDNKEIMEIGER